jgi:hypothetical protein
MKIRFVRGKDFTSLLIAFVSRGWPSHTEAVLPNGSLLGARLGTGVSIMPAGYDKGSISMEMVVDLPSTPAIDEKFYEFLSSQIGKPYDLRAVFGLAFDSDWRTRAGGWFCSELMARGMEVSKWFDSELQPAALQQVGIRLQVPNNLISPRDFLLILSSHVVMPAPQIIK